MKIQLTRLGKLTLPLLFILLLINGCKKTDYKKGQDVTDTNKTTPHVVMYAPMNVKMPVGLVDENGNIFPVKKMSSSRLTGDFEGCGEKDYLITLAYNGFTATRSAPEGPYYISHTWTVEVPSDNFTLLGSSSIWKGYQRHIYTFGSTSSWVNSTYGLGSPTSFTINDNGTTVNMKRYTVNYTITMSESDFCNSGTFHTYPRIRTDCSEFPTIIPIGSPSYYVGQFTPNTYKVYQWGAMNNGSNPSLHQFDAFPLIVTPPPCHSPALGASPEHVIYYRKQGASTWTSITTTNLNTITVDVTLTGAGTYEIQSKGIVTTGVYSSLSPISTFTVN